MVGSSVLLHQVFLYRRQGFRTSFPPQTAWQTLLHKRHDFRCSMRYTKDCSADSMACSLDSDCPGRELRSHTEEMFGACAVYSSSMRSLECFVNNWPHDGYTLLFRVFVGRAYLQLVTPQLRKSGRGEKKPYFAGDQNVFADVWGNGGRDGNRTYSAGLIFSRLPVRSISRLPFAICNHWVLTRRLSEILICRERLISLGGLSVCALCPVLGSAVFLRLALLRGG